MGHVFPFEDELLQINAEMKIRVATPLTTIFIPQGELRSRMLYYSAANHSGNIAGALDSGFVSASPVAQRAVSGPGGNPSLPAVRQNQLETT
jgi:hypothetical protein